MNRPMASTPQQSSGKALAIKVPAVTTQRTLAKAGMSAAMAVLVWTAMKRGRGVMGYHTLAGVALLGFTVWHLTLYKARNKTYE